MAPKMYSLTFFAAFFLVLSVRGEPTKKGNPLVQSFRQYRECARGNKDCRRRELRIRLIEARTKDYKVGPSLESGAVICPRIFQEGFSIQCLNVREGDGPVVWEIDGRPHSMDPEVPYTIQGDCEGIASPFPWERFAGRRVAIRCLSNDRKTFGGAANVTFTIGACGKEKQSDSKTASVNQKPNTRSPRPRSGALTATQSPERQCNFAPPAGTTATGRRRLPSAATILNILFGGRNTLTTCAPTQLSSSCSRVGISSRGPSVYIRECLRPAGSQAREGENSTRAFISFGGTARTKKGRDIISCMRELARNGSTVPISLGRDCCNADRGLVFVSSSSRKLFYRDCQRCGGCRPKAEEDGALPNCTSVCKN